MDQQFAKSTERMVNAAAQQIPDMSAPDFMRMTATMVNGWTEMNNHLLSFAQMSLRNNLNAAQELRDCHTPQDFVEAQFRLARRNYECYLDEAQQIGTLMAQLSSEAVQCLTPDRR